MSKIFTRVACAISGGVDSAVSALRLKQHGYKVTGVFMKNWDPADEVSHCTYDYDLKSARHVCRKLGIELIEFDFVKQYWSNVFEPLLAAYEKGITPNPDILCNRFVKFDLLHRELIKSGEFDAFATGHYAQNSLGNFLQFYNPHTPESARLMRSADMVKDQTFWLCTVNGEHLNRCMFPIGDLLKPQVKEIARENDLIPQAERPESMGICFIGKRKFASFISEYLPNKPGVIKSLDSDITLGEHQGIHHYTLGQRIAVNAPHQGPFFVAKLDPLTQSVFVVKNTRNPHLFMRRCETDPIVCVTRDAMASLPTDSCEFQWQNKWRAVSCRMEQLEPSFRQTSSRIGPALSVKLAKAMRCVAAGQWAAFYRGQECFGGAQITKSFTLAEDEHRTEPVSTWNVHDYLLTYDNSSNSKAAIKSYG